MKKVRVAVIGCGGIANGKHLPALKKLENVELVAFCDIVETRAKEAAEKYGVKGAKVYTDYHKLLKAEKPEVVHVCTPNKSHADISIGALEAGAHVLCEKPMAKSAADARRMLEAAKRTGKKLSIAYQNRYRPDSIYLKKTCERGDLGEVYFAKAHAVRRRAVPTWGVFMDKEEQGGGPLIDIGTHALDLTLWMMDNYKPRYAVGTVYQKIGPVGSEANAWGNWKPEAYDVEDAAFGFVVMENGATIFLESSWALNTLQTGEARTSLSGTQGGADMQDGLRINGEDFGKLYEKKPGLSAAGVDFYDGGAENASDVEARTWIDAVIHDKEPMVKPEQALVVTEILEAIYESAKTGAPVYFNH